MANVDEQRAEELAAMNNERRTFERRQRAFQKVIQQFAPQGNGAPAKADLEELDTADADHRKAVAAMDRISEEIRAGKR
ncbi:hypothetical protein hmeg3_14740 [Herbaspirillum sp. meg3]|uniref:hypothetical protein n=1 Tax=Herbaspirillum sp. meg3 TaxID=2025949 RepID=UPI000B98C020|nr:hypothetical protein [Herbaspirillum sp. meg3]ASU39423.1 hypothetical protein hmeg3_14740 [Herbaspirillum sp. meg3]